MTSTAALLARAASQVHISTSPAPKNLGESKQILAALQKFGEVATFRNLKYDVLNKSYNRERPILAIFESGDAAHRAITSSPVTVTLSPAARSAPTPTSHLSSESTSPSSVPNSNSEAAIITCTIQPSRHNHANTLKRNPFHSTYRVHKDNAIYEDMMSAETGVPLKELADVLQRPKPLVGPSVSRAENARMGGESLMDLWREGMASEEVEHSWKEREEEKSAKTGLRRLSLQMNRRQRMEEDGGDYGRGG